MNTSRTRGLAVLALIALWAAFSSPFNDNSLPGDATQEELEALGVHVHGPPDADPPIAGVATLPEEDMDRVYPSLEAAKIGCLGVCGHGLCGLYVDVKDYHRARALLSKLRDRFGVRIALWEPQHVAQSRR